MLQERRAELTETSAARQSHQEGSDSVIRPQRRGLGGEWAEFSWDEIERSVPDRFERIGTFSTSAPCAPTNDASPCMTAGLWCMR
jgi:hypothetical protein